MIEKDWWDRIYLSPENEKDPVLRMGFAIWLQDELDDLAGAAYLHWLLDVSEINFWQDCRAEPVRTPWTDGILGWWWYSATENHPYVPGNALPLDICHQLKKGLGKDTTTIDFKNPRAAEEAALAAWRQVRSPHHAGK